MREILFTGKGTDGNGWANGLLTIMWGKYHIINLEDENTAYEVDPETVCQYTNVVDVEGVKIFEGDICRFSYFNYSHAGVVLYKDSCFILARKSVVGAYGEIATCTIYLKDAKNLRVVGNIYDNPVLLEVHQNAKI